MSTKKVGESPTELPLDFLRSLLNELSEGVFFKNREGRFLLGNQVLAEQMGLKDPELLIGKTNHDFYPKDLADEFDIAERTVMESGESLIDQLEDQEIRGSQRWLLVTKVPVVAQNKRVVGLVGICRDVTGIKRTEEELLHERNLFRSLIEILPLSMYTKDIETRKTLSNPVDLRTIGAKSEAEVLGKTDFDLFPKEVAENFYADDRSVLDTGNPVLGREEYYFGAEGKKRWLLTSKVPLRDSNGSITGLVGVALEITDRKEALEETEFRLLELDAVNQISAAMRSAQTVEQMLPPMLETTIHVLKAARGIIWLHEQGRELLQPAFTKGYGGPGEPPMPNFVRPFEGLVGRVFTSAQPEAGQIDSGLVSGELSVAVAIRSANSVQGVLTLDMASPRVMENAEVRLLTTLCEIAGNALERTRTQEQTQRRLRHLTSLSEIDRAITSSLDLRVSLTIVLNHIIHQLKVDATDILMFTPGSQALDFFVGIGFRSDTERSRVPLGHGNAGLAALERRTIHIANVKEDAQNVLQPLVEGEDFIGYYGIPLVAKGQIRAVLEVFHRSPLEPDSEWVGFLKNFAGQSAIAIDNVTLFDSLQQSNAELFLAYDATIEGWSRALDLRDKETEGHTLRVTEMTVRLARIFGMIESELIQIRWGALLHDIGKMGVPDSILHKPGPLTDEEWIVMKKHPTLAYEMLFPIRYLRGALDIPYRHHEKWDGNGYPHGLKGDQIPLAARIFSIVDVWDALSSDRPYRAAWPASKVREHVQSLSGTHFDPEVVRKCLESEVFSKDSL